MILIPIFMPQPKLGFYIHSLEEREKVIARREAVLLVVTQHNGLTLQEIAIKTNQDIRITEAILTVLKRYGMIESVYTKQGKIWRKIKQ